VTHADPFRTVGPMARIGADVAALEDLAGQLGRASDSLRRSASRIDGTLARSGWHGRDADRFRREWQHRHRRDLRSRADRFGELAAAVRRHAAEQRRVSASDGGTHAATGLPSDLDRGTTWSGTLRGSVGMWSALVGGTVTLADAGERTLITVERHRGVGVGAAAGATASAGTSDRRVDVGVTVAGDARIQGTETRSYLVDRDDVTATLLAVAAEQGVTSALGPVGSALSAAGSVLNAVGSAVGVDVPRLTPVEPDRTETLIGVAVDGSALVALAGPGGRLGRGSATAEGTVSVGTATEDDRSWAVLSADGSFGAALSSRFLPAGSRPEAGAEVSLRVDVPLEDRRGHGEGAPVVVTVSSTGVAGLAPGQTLVSRSTFSTDQLGSALGSTRDAIGALGRGDADRAVADLLRVSVDTVPEHHDTWTVDSRPGGMDLGGSVPLGSLSVEGTSRTWRRGA